MNRKGLLNDEKGAVLPIVAFFIAFVFIGFAAIVVDAGVLYNQRRQMVAAADAGALAGAKEMQDKSNTKAEIESVAVSVAILNGADPGTTTAIAVFGSDNKYKSPYVKVDSYHETDLFFGKALTNEKPNIHASAVAISEKLLNPGMIPLFMLDVEAKKNVGSPVILHDKPVILPDGTELSFSAGLLYLDSNTSGMPGVRMFLGEREIEMPASFTTSLNSGYIPGKAGLGEFGDDKELKVSYFEAWFQKAAEHSPVSSERRAYVTGFLPLMNTTKYLADSTKKDIPVDEFAEFVLVDYSEKKKADGVATAFKVTDYTTKPIVVNYQLIAGSSVNKFGEIGADKKQIIGYFTGKVITRADVLSGNYLGTIYENDSIKRVRLVD